MATAAMTTAAKMALRITTTDFDTEISRLIDAAMLDLGIAGVEVPETADAIVTTAVLTYVKLHFGQPDEWDRLKLSYDEQKAQLVTATGYTDWLGADVTPADLLEGD